MVVDAEISSNTFIKLLQSYKGKIKFHNIYRRTSLERTLWQIDLEHDYLDCNTELIGPGKTLTWICVDILHTHKEIIHILKSIAKYLDRKDIYYEQPYKFNGNVYIYI
uniref:Uncharacterized protein n=1 Tax=viral metagenome TaxID=1070528 RepID=A0A6C0CLT7_9ZZZZ